MTQIIPVQKIIKIYVVVMWETSEIRTYISKDAAEKFLLSEGLKKIDISLKGDEIWANSKIDFENGIYSTVSCHEHFI